MNESEAAQRLLRAQARLLALANSGRDPMLHIEEFMEATDEMAAAEAALPNRHKRDLRVSALESMIEELDQLLEGNAAVDLEVFPPAVFPAGIRDKVVTARRLLNEARTAIVESRR